MQSGGGTDSKGCGRQTETNRGGFRKKKKLAKTWLRPTEADIGANNGRLAKAVRGQSIDTVHCFTSGPKEGESSIDQSLDQDPKCIKDEF